MTKKEEEKRKKNIERAEQALENQEGSKIMRAIIAKTYSRHANLTEQEFLKEIGFEGSGKNEEEAIRIATFNVLTEITMQLFRAQRTIDLATNTLNLFLNGKDGEKK